MYGQLSIDSRYTALVYMYLLQAQYGGEAFDKLADMIYNTLDQYSIYQRYLLYTDYNKVMLQPSRMTTTAETGNYKLIVYE